MRLALTLWRSTHPGPTLVVTALAVALGVSIELDLARLALLVVSVFAGQLSIGLSNDALDAPRDRATGRADKPLAHPDAPVRAAWIAAAGSLVAALALSLALAWPVALAHAVFLVCAWAYNVRLKSTVWSAACFVVGFGVVPSIVTLAQTTPELAPTWAWIAGGALGVAVHFSNVLPDLDDDARTGVRGLPHRIGRRGSVAIAFVALAAGAVTVAVALGGWIAWSGCAAVAVVAALGLAHGLRRTPSRTSFRLVMLAALLLAVQLVATGGLAG